MASKLFSAKSKNSINHKFREKRFKFYTDLLAKVPHDQPLRVLDIGGTEIFWERMNFLNDNQVYITLLNLKEVAVRNNNVTSIKGDACNLSEFKDNEFDIVFSNSVIEHLFTKENQRKMADEARRVGQYYYIQTPNYYFPIEPHWMFPFFQFLPFGIRVFLTRNLSLGHCKKSASKAAAINKVDEVKLLTEKEMKQMFPDGRVYREYFLGLKKSITLYRFPQ